MRCGCGNRAFPLAIDATNPRHLQSPRRFSRHIDKWRRRSPPRFNSRTMRTPVALPTTQPFAFCQVCQSSVLLDPTQHLLRSDKTLADFETYLHEQNVTYLVFTSIEDSLPVTFYPELGRSPRVDVGHFEFVSVAFSPFGPDVWLYRLRND